MTPPAAADIRRLLNQRTAAAIEASRENGGVVPEAEMESLDRLARLVELAEKTSPREPPRRAWAFAIVLGVTMAVLSVLLFARARRTPIELDVDATQVSFSLPSEQIVFENLELTSLGVSGLARISLPEPFREQGGVDAVENSGQAIRLTAGETGGRRGAIGIAQIKPQKDAQVELRVDGQAGQYRLSLRDSAITIEVGVLGPVNVAVAGLGIRLVDFVAPQSIILEPASEGVDLDVVFRNPDRAATTPQVPVTKVAFWRVDEFGDRRLSVVRTLSTVLGGTLYFEALNGATRQLRSGEILRFSESAGEVRTVRLRPDRISLSFHGHVRGMTTGDEDERRSLMPSWLDLLRAQHGLSLLWGSTLYIAGVATAVLRWLKGPL